MAILNSFEGLWTENCPNVKQYNDSLRFGTTSVSPSVLVNLIMLLRIGYGKCSMILQTMVQGYGLGSNSSCQIGRNSPASIFSLKKKIKERKVKIMFNHEQPNRVRNVQTLGTVEYWNITWHADGTATCFAVLVLDNPLQLLGLAGNHESSLLPEPILLLSLLQKPQKCWLSETSQLEDEPLCCLPLDRKNHEIPFRNKFWWSCVVSFSSTDGTSRRTLCSFWKKGLSFTEDPLLFT